MRTSGCFILAKLSKKKKKKKNLVTRKVYADIWYEMKDLVILIKTRTL